MEGDLRFPPPCQISPPSVQRVAPAGRKTSKSDSEEIKYRQVCAARNAAGNK